MPVTDTLLVNESRDRYLTYALSVISSRALPDIRDGLKPVQRRILYAMLQNLGLRPTSSHRKSAAVVGEVLARFHPHGDVACYEAMVRLAQDFSLRYPLVDGQGNFGSLDGDSPAAYRYTEARLREMALDVIGEINEETVGFRDNFDATTLEPIVLPSRVPHLLINGAAGIAVGMATNIPPHNLSDVVRACIELSEDPEVTDAKLAATVKAPDFPTGCIILNTQKELTELYRTGRGAIRMRGEWKLEEGKRGKQFIVVTSIPYAVNKSQLVEAIANLIVERKVPQLSDVRDESTDIVRVVLELTPGADPEVAMAYVFRNTSLETAFNANFTALVPGPDGALRPEQVSLRTCLSHFLKFREEVTDKRLRFEKKQLLERIHILEGLVLVFDALDEAIRIVRKSSGRQDSAERLRERFKLSEIQSFAIVDMKIYQLSRTTIEEIRAELKEKAGRVDAIDKILKSPAKIREMVRKDLLEMVEKYGDRRKSKLVKDTEEPEFRAEDYVVQEDVYAIVTADGWLKRIRQTNELSTTRLREGDTIRRAHALNTIDVIVFFTNLGSVYAMKVADVPASSGYGDPVQKFFKFRDGETIIESFGLRHHQKTGDLIPDPMDIVEGQQLVFVTRQGIGCLVTVEGLTQIKRSGKRVVKVREGDYLTAVTRPGEKLALITRRGQGLLITGKEVPERQAGALGVSLIDVRDDDALVAAHGGPKTMKFKLKLEGGRTVDLDAKDITAGHRALKGTKVIARGEIISVEKV